MFRRWRQGLKPKAKKLSVDDSLLRIVELIAASKSHYDSAAVGAPQLRRVAEIAATALASVFEGTAPGKIEQQISDIIADLEAHPNEILWGESSRRAWHGEGAE